MTGAMFGLGLSRLLPAPVRTPMIATVTRIERSVTDALDARDLATKRRDASTPYAGERVAVLGFLRAPTGLGQGARLMRAQLQRDAIVNAGFDIDALLGRDHAARQKILADIAAFAPSDLILHVNPPLFRRIIRRLPRALPCAVIGYWAWELERLPPDWSRDAALCDEIWTPSAFVAGAVRASLPEFSGAVRVVPHPVDATSILPLTPEGRTTARRAFGAPEDAFIAGFSFAMASNFARKNPLAAIKAFQRAFPSSENAILMLRCLDAADYPDGRHALARATREDPRIRLLQDTTHDITTFYQALDVYLSLHRSEGFGLQMAEALQAGAHVIATAWGMSDTIATHPYFHGIGATLIPVRDPQGTYTDTPDARWAEADIDEAARQLRQRAGV